MQPSGTTFDVREDLSLRIDEFDHAMNEAGFIGHVVFPLLPREKKSGKMPRVKLEQTLEELDTRRNPDGTFGRSKTEFSDDSYDTQTYGLEAVLDDETETRYDDLIDAETYEGNRIEAALLRAFEIGVANYCTTEANFDGSRVHTPATSWTDRINALPITNIDTYRDALADDLGQEPNALICTRTTFRDLINNSQVIDRSKGQNYQDVRPGAMNLAALAMALDLDRIIVANGRKSATAPGGARSLTKIWPVNRAILARVAVTADPGEICWGRTPIWSPFSAQGPDGRLGVIAESYDEVQRLGSIQRRRTNYGRKILHVQAAHLIKL